MLLRKDGDSYLVDGSLLAALLKDRSTGKNIIYGTDNYASKGHKSSDPILLSDLSGKKNPIRPRVAKSKAEQQKRIKDKAEVFTPSWVCNRQNNLVDNAWFGAEGVFNAEVEDGWKAAEGKIEFAKYGKSWQDYVKDPRLEITCGEAPYLTSRYDAVSGSFIASRERIGLLDRKLRVVSENCDSEEEWLLWAKEAYKACYGYEYQGDNLLIARQNLLFAFADSFSDKFGKMPEDSAIEEIAEIIVWNLFQMDGLKYVAPESCQDSVIETVNIFGENEVIGEKCRGCAEGDPYRHNGKYAFVMDWEKGKKIKFISLIRNF